MSRVWCGVKRGRGCVSRGRGGRRRRVATAVLVGALRVIKQSIQITITTTVIPKSHDSRHNRPASVKVIFTISIHGGCELASNGVELGRESLSPLFLRVLCRIIK